MGEKKEASEEVTGGSVLIENRGGVIRGGGVGGRRVLRECLWGEGGGAKYFFRGRDSHKVL